VTARLAMGNANQRGGDPVSPQHRTVRESPPPLLGNEKKKSKCSDEIEAHEETKGADDGTVDGDDRTAADAIGADEEISDGMDDYAGGDADSSVEGASDAEVAAGTVPKPARTGKVRGVGGEFLPVESGPAAGTFASMAAALQAAKQHKDPNGATLNWKAAGGNSRYRNKKCVSHVDLYIHKVMRQSRV
jgi:hypothetical protein